MTDKYAELRRLAEDATPGRVYDRLPEAGGGIKYHCFGDDGSIVLQVDHKNGEFGFIGPRGEQDEAFFLKCTPDTIISLLDELEACRKDAERYRWLLENSVCALNGNTHPVLVCSSNLPVIGWREEITRRIDAAAIHAAIQEQKP